MLLECAHVVASARKWLHKIQGYFKNICGKTEFKDKCILVQKFLKFMHTRGLSKGHGKCTL